MNSDPITVFVQYQSQPGMEDVTKKRLASLIASVVSEAACISINLHQSISEPTRFMLYETWTDKEIYLGEHMQTPHMQSFIQQAGEFLAAPPEISLWHFLRPT
jgi:quinol monooxygenase YgiN